MAKGSCERRGQRASPRGPGVSVPGQDQPCVLHPPSPSMCQSSAVRVLTVSKPTSASAVQLAERIPQVESMLEKRGLRSMEARAARGWKRIRWCGELGLGRYTQRKETQDRNGLDNLDKGPWSSFRGLSGARDLLPCHIRELHHSLRTPPAGPLAARDSPGRKNRAPVRECHSLSLFTQVHHWRPQKLISRASSSA